MARRERDKGDAELAAVVAEARAAGASVEWPKFKAWWLARVCQDGRRRLLIRQAVHDAAAGAFAAGRREGGHD